jgi:formylglycine-generating enzyme required for sulfatase activity
MGDKWKPKESLSEPWRSLVLGALALKKEERDGSVSEWWSRSLSRSVKPLEIVINIPQVEKSLEEKSVKEKSREREKGLLTFNFEVVTVNNSGKIINKKPGSAKYYVEKLGNDVELEMVAISGGTFTMGSPSSEKDSRDSERPQHKVKVREFFIGKYPVTQAEWRVVAGWSKIERDLNPNPSCFKGDNRPVEQVSWYDAVEFCQRLSKKTGKQYSLPSEAQWEYACRAGTTTPFYFGETITTELVNYDGNYSYGNGPKGEYREETTPVGSFPPNTFGLYDMHGNVWEWCADSWQNNYQGAPKDDRPWLVKDNDNRYSLRGGSWYYLPRDCLSAYRYGNIGCRVASVGPGFF